MMQRWYHVESLKGQRHDRIQTESQDCKRLDGSRQHGVESYMKYSAGRLISQEFTIFMQGGI